MQVMPGLARDKRLGGFDLQDVEQNVHAGAKYMKHLLRVYFNGDGLEGQERLRLALAAYNAGPNAIGKAREKAGDMGLDTGKWFGHVEKGARRLVGLEPVRYVSSINNLYVAYKLSSKSLSRRVMIKDRIVAQENRNKGTGLLSTAGAPRTGRE
jgi:membrane-bound lytic murein transglycosylase MltF